MKKTALVLSGGGSRGAYEIGVWKALKKLRIRIHMAFGTSVGAINSAMVVRKDLKLAEELWKQLETDMIFDIQPGDGPVEEALAYAKEIVLHGGAGNSGLSGLLHKYIDEHKIRSSRTGFGLVATEYPSRRECVMYKDDIPEGLMIDYIMASASCFPAVQKYVIDDKKYIDGGYHDNLPVSMALEKKADRIIAVDLQAPGTVDHEAIRHAENTCDEFHMIRCTLDLGNFLIFDRDNTARIMRLGYLDTMRHFGKYDGIRYTFRKKSFTPHQMHGADNAAYILGLDPCEIYDRDMFCASVRMHIADLRLSSAKRSKAMHYLRTVKLVGAKKALSTLKDVTADTDLHAQLMLYIAENLKENENRSFFLKPDIFKLLESEIQAANFIVKEKLL